MPPGPTPAEIKEYVRHFLVFSTFLLHVITQYIRKNTHQFQQDNQALTQGHLVLLEVQYQSHRSLKHCNVTRH